jgi:hypothetical protein
MPLIWNHLLKTYTWSRGISHTSKWSYEHQEQTSKFTRKQIKPRKCRVAIHIMHMSIPRNYYQHMHNIHTPTLAQQKVELYL